ncbi:MAG: hypothetical protein PHF57_12220 [Methanoregula sp.]|jgi:hypothetical protein|nr:hypothetical protein [Methanoregula sp.]MDD5188961.1 hypothetical protein [Methanoregula sp.]
MEEEPRIVKQSDIDWLLSLRIVNAEKAIEEMKKDRFIVVIDDKELLLDRLSRRGSKPEVSVPMGQIIISSEECESIIQTHKVLLQTFEIALKYGIVKVVDQKPKKKTNPRRGTSKKKNVLRITQKKIDEMLAEYSDPQTLEYMQGQLELLKNEGRLIVVNEKTPNTSRGNS